MRRRAALLGVAAVSCLATSCIWSAPVGTPQQVFSYNFDGYHSDKSVSAQISADGTHVLFTSVTNTYSDQGEDSQVTRRVRLETVGGIEVASAVGELPSVSSDGSRVALARRRSSTTTVADVYLLDVASGQETLISTGFNGATADGTSTTPSISADGSVVVFSSKATNLTAATGTATGDIYRFHIDSGITELVSSAPGGQPADGDSGGPEVSADGGIVAFSSSATNLVPGDTNTDWDVFLVDGAGNIAKRSNGLGGTEATGRSLLAALSGDGTTVGFSSTANNLVTGDTQTSATRGDLFVAGPTGAAELVSVEPTGAQVSLEKNPYLADLSFDGSLVLFSYSTLPRLPLPFGTLVALLRDRQLASTTVTSKANGGPAEPQATAPHLTGDGRYVLLSSYAITAEDPVSGSYEMDLSFKLQTAQDVRVDQISPAGIAAGQSGPVTITGAGFHDGATVVASRGNQTTGVTFSDIQVIDRSTITAVAHVAPSVPTGTKQVWVDTPHTVALGTGAASSTSCRCFAVT